MRLVHHPHRAFGVTEQEGVANRSLRCTALWPPPLPSSSTSRTGIDAESSTVAAKAASSVYSSGGEISGHHTARSP
jgi:hypothetical protein